MGDVIRIGAGYHPNQRDREQRARPNQIRQGKSKAQARDRKNEQQREVNSALEELGIKRFDKEFRRLRKMATAAPEDFCARDTAYALLRAQLAMAISALPVLEENLHKWKNDKASYALVSLSSHLRELQHDLRAFGDQTETMVRIRDVAIQTVMRELATSVVQDFVRARQDVHSKLKGETARAVDERLRIVQEALAGHFTKAESEAAKNLATVLGIK